MDLSSGTSLEQWEKVVAQHQAIYPARRRKWEDGLTIKLNSLLIPASIEVFITVDFADIDTSLYFQPKKGALPKDKLALRQAPVLTTLYSEFLYELGQTIESYWLATMQLPVIGDSLTTYTLFGAEYDSPEDVDSEQVMSWFNVTGREIMLPGRRKCTTCVSLSLTEKAG
jgi:hypothetical protein